MVLSGFPIGPSALALAKERILLDTRLHVNGVCFLFLPRLKLIVEGGGKVCRFVVLVISGINMTRTHRGLFPSLVLLVLFFLGLVSGIHQLRTLDHLRARASDETQTKAAIRLLRRLLGETSRDFVVSVNNSLSLQGLDVCELRSESNHKVVAVGSSGVAVTAGVYHYLKYYCNCHVSWSGDQLRVPRPLPLITGVLRISSQHR